MKGPFEWTGPPVRSSTRTLLRHVHLHSFDIQDSRQSKRLMMEVLRRSCVLGESYLFGSWWDIYSILLTTTRLPTCDDSPLFTFALIFLIFCIFHLPVHCRFKVLYLLFHYCLARLRWNRCPEKYKFQFKSNFIKQKRLMWLISLTGNKPHDEDHYRPSVGYRKHLSCHN